MSKTLAVKLIINLFFNYTYLVLPLNFINLKHFRDY